MIEATPIYSDLAERSAGGGGIALHHTSGGSGASPRASPARAKSKSLLLAPAPLGQVETIMKLRTVDDAEAAAWLQTLNNAMVRALGGEASGSSPALLPSARLPPAVAAHFSDSESSDSDDESTNGSGGAAEANGGGAQAINLPARRGRRGRGASSGDAQPFGNVAIVIMQRGAHLGSGSSPHTRGARRRRWRNLTLHLRCSSLRR